MSVYSMSCFVDLPKPDSNAVGQVSLNEETVRNPPSRPPLPVVNRPKVSKMCMSKWNYFLFLKKCLYIKYHTKITNFYYIYYIKFKIKSFDFSDIVSI